MFWNIFEKLLLVNFIILTTYTTTFAAEHRKRYINFDQYTQIHSTFDPQKLTVNKNSDELTTEYEMKINSGLMGGHRKITATSKNAENSEEDKAELDDELYLSSAGNGKERPVNHDDDDDKKTLAQQVKEGKYGLIQNEIYSSKPKRPGIISYMSNPDVPKDNIKNLGGLEKEDIWLAENHLLVLKGGRFPDQKKESSNNDEPEWPPIDDYQAPKRQVRIPNQPDVPPPFPVQLTEGGPVKLIGKNETDNHENGSQWIEGLVLFNSTNLAFTNSPSNETTDDIINGKTKSGTFGGIVGPFFPHLPPGTVFVPPPSNQSDYDEDDQSIYYPPPYSFKYNQDNTTAVPPGPLVPGIILPPPPDFFSSLDEKKTTTEKNRVKCIKCTSSSDSKSTTKSYKINSSTASTKEIRRPFTMKPINKLKYKTSAYTESSTKYPDKPLKYFTVTTPISKINTIEISDIQPVKSTTTNQVFSTKLENQKNRWQSGFNKSRPIVAYYPTSTPSAHNTVDVTPVSLKTIINTEKKVGNSASYYFYEEANSDSSDSTTNPTIYFQETTERPLYKVNKLSQSELDKKNSYYNIEITPSQQTAEEYSVEVIEPVIKPSPKYQYRTSDASSVPSIKFPRAQGQRGLSDTSTLYYQDVTERPQYNLFTTPSPKNFIATSPTVKYTQKAKPKPIYQYSFQAINYPPQSHTNYNQKIVNHSPKQANFNEWKEIQEEDQGYDYPAVEENEQIEEPQYNNKHNYHIRVTTPNPTHAYYTKQDEQLFDDVTKEYFTNFGKKIKYQKLPSTTPLYGKSDITEKSIRPSHNTYVTDYYESKPTTAHKAPKVKVFYGDQSNKFSIKDDTRVNYQHPLPPFNPDAEFLPGYNPKEHETLAPIRNQPQQNYHYTHSHLPERKLIPILRYNGQQVPQQSEVAPTSYLSLSNSNDDRRNYLEQPISLADDIAVNYRNPRPPINPDAEFINPAAGQAESSVHPGSYVTYRLPGDGGHVYFFTPVITQRQDGYLNSRTHGLRSPRQISDSKV
ncbi:uncharacterized protein [Chelonus insularis]|uniref:uncharacterized protein n=1 Tax=Chelonus insularis TaxID=460826 RepID=UPI00158A0721|nr:uncharacterized protein LOC118074929 [Chelonus insularis]